MKNERVYEVTEAERNSEAFFVGSRSVYDEIPFHLNQAALERNRALIALWNWVKRYVADIVLRWRHWRNERQAVKELRVLEGDLLKDLGLTYGDLDRLRAGAVSTSQLETERRVSAGSRKEINRSAKLFQLPGKWPTMDASNHSVRLRNCG